MKKADAMKEFSSPNCFEILQDDIKENDHDLNENYPIDKNSYFKKGIEKQCPMETQKLLRQ